jgi:hypothetical protein
VLILLKKSGDISSKHKTRQIRNREFQTLGIGTTTMEIYVEGKFDICKTFDKTSLTPPLFMEVSGPSQEMLTQL